MDGNCVCHHLIKTTEYIWGTISPWAWKFSPQLDMICHAFCILTLAIVSQNWNKYMSVCDLIKVTSMYCDCFHCLLSCLHIDIPFHCYLLHRYLLLFSYLAVFFSSLSFCLQNYYFKKSNCFSMMNSCKKRIITIGSPLQNLFEYVLQKS